MKKMSWVVLVFALLAMLVVPSVSAAQAKATTPQLNVFAAASLNKAFPAMVPVFKKNNPQYKNVKFVFNFQGTDTLVAQIQQGAPADVFAGASTKYGTTLFNAKLIATPRHFCQNRLEVILPASNPAGITSLADIATKADYVASGFQSDLTSTLVINGNSGIQSYSETGTINITSFKDGANATISSSGVDKLGGGTYDVFGTFTLTGMGSWAGTTYTAAPGTNAFTLNLSRRSRSTSALSWATTLSSSAVLELTGSSAWLK